MDQLNKKSEQPKRRVLRARRRNRASPAQDIPGEDSESHRDGRRYGDGNSDRTLVRQYCVHLMTGRRRPTRLAGYTALPSIAQAQASKRWMKIAAAAKRNNLAWRGKMEGDRCRKRGSRLRKEGGVGGRPKKGEGEAEKEEEGTRVGFELFLKMFKEEMVNQGVPLPTQDLETIATQVWNDMTPDEKRIFVQAARGTKKQEKGERGNQKENKKVKKGSKEVVKPKKRVQQDEAWPFYEKVTTSPLVGIAAQAARDLGWKRPTIDSAAEQGVAMDLE